MIDVHLCLQEISNLISVLPEHRHKSSVLLLPSWSGTNERESKEAAACPDLPSHHKARVLFVPHVAQGHVGKDVLGYFCYRYVILFLFWVLFTVWGIWKELL